MIRKALALTLGTLFLAPVVSHATISILIQADLLKDQNGVPIPQNSLLLLIASTENATFETIVEGGTSAKNSRLSSSGDDYVVFRTAVNTTGENGVYDIATGGLNLGDVPNWNPGDPLALVWLPSLNASTSLIGAGTRYGQYSKIILVPNEGVPWITPPDGTSNHSLAFYTQDGGTFSPGPTASNPAAAGRSTGTVAPVPEPGSAALLAFGLLGLASRRRRR